jgi:hypothetical protein
MDDDHVSGAIERIEQGLAHEDPAFVQRVRALHRAEIGTAVTVFVLLATGTVLLTVGLATPSWFAWGAGLVALLVAVLVDEHHKHTLRRNP